MFKSSCRRLSLSAASCKTALAAMLALSTGLAQAGQFDPPPSKHFAGAAKVQVVDFGDSLVDVGTYSPIAGLLFGGGRFTTNPGTIFVQDVARDYGSPLTPAFLGGFGLPLFPAGGLGYAQGGSRVSLQPGVDHAAGNAPNADFAQETTVPVKDQLQAYLRVHKRFNSAQLVVMNGGANDVFFNLQVAQAAGTAQAQQAALQAIKQAATDLAELAESAVAHGASHVVLLNLPNIGAAPQGAASADHGQSLTQVSQLFNATLAGALQQEQLGHKVVLVDVFAFVDGIMAKAAANGFTVTNTGTACNLQAQVARATRLGLDNPSVFGGSLFCSPRTFTTPDADQTFMFADTVHPSAHLGALVAQFVEQQIAASGW